MLSDFLNHVQNGKYYNFFKGKILTLNMYLPITRNISHLFKIYAFIMKNFFCYPRKYQMKMHFNISSTNLKKLKTIINFSRAKMSYSRKNWAQSLYSCDKR